MSGVSQSSGHAIDGFDAVAYFKGGSPVAGRAEHAVEFEDATWLFSNQENAKAFEASPQQYAPAYLGHCAFATSLGKTEAGNPARWAIRDGRLFLNSNAVAHLLWKLLPGRIEAGDRKWKDRS